VGFWTGSYVDGAYRNGDWVWNCQGCSEGGECDGSEDVLCSPQHYKTVPQFPLTTLQKCQKCPLGLMCLDGSCSTRGLDGPTPSLECPPEDATVIIGEWMQGSEKGKYMLNSCPQGYSKKGIEKVVEDMMQCKECNRVLQYILDPNKHDCQRCPPGLTCRGNDVISHVVAGSEWSVEGPIMRLHACPTGYKVWPQLARALFDPEIHAPLQECAVCEEGMECTFDRCTNCSMCRRGKYKDSPGTAPCRKCAAGKYNTKTMSVSESFCIPCPDGANTRGLEGATSINDCECVDNMYMTENKTGEFGMACFACPAAAMCPDGM